MPKFSSEDYAQKLKDPRWQKKRLEIFQRDDFMCWNCRGKDKTLHVHHKCYLPKLDPWEYDARYLITLCEECHEQIKSLENKIRKAIVRAYGVVSPDFEKMIIVSILYHDKELFEELFWNVFANVRHEFIGEIFRG